jgi:hypothetical protein
MLLADRVAQYAIEAEALGGAAGLFDADLLTSMQSANPRYVLDEHAAGACTELIRSADGLFDPSSELLRLPSESFWLEMRQEASSAREIPDGSRIGVLVQAEPNGRSGFIRHFASKPNGVCQEYPVWTEFDFDQPPELSERSFRLAHGEFDHLSSLLDHAVVHLDRHWASSPAVGGAGEAGNPQQLFAEAVWFDLPLISAFAALLNSPDIVAIRKSELHRLNRARARRSRPPLLDHIEVRLVLGEEHRNAASSSAHHRTPPRLHFVRGHMVRRSGKTFWRASHLRGDTSKAVLRKTVRVTAARSARR